MRFPPSDGSSTDGPPHDGPSVDGGRWIDIGSAAEVGRGQAVAAEVAGAAGELDLVVWRAFDGDLRVMEARCPHQWSHLAAEGVVDGDEIVCTAHFWRFDAEGRGTKLNIRGRRDPKADIPVFSCRERDGRIEVHLTD